MNEQNPTEVRWRRAGRESWSGPPPGGDLAEDGAMIFAFRTDLPERRCPTCGRGRLLWRVDIALPSPFPVIGSAGSGCTRGHALHGVPLSWTEVAHLFAAAAGAVRGREPFTEWDARHSDMRARQAARATWLSQRGRQQRRLALRVWSEDPRLDVQTTEMVVSGVLSEPVRRRSEEHDGRSADC